MQQKQKIRKRSSSSRKKTQNNLIIGFIVLQAKIAKHAFQKSDYRYLLMDHMIRKSGDWHFFDCKSAKGLADTPRT